MADCKERKRVDYKQVVSELLKRKKLFYIVLPYIQYTTNV